MLLVALVALTTWVSSARAVESGPTLETAPATLANALHCPATFKDANHEPVLLVHGTFTDDKANWSWNYLPALTKLGFDVCTVTLPGYSLDDMQIQAEYVVYGVRQIAQRTGEKVELIGASQGTLHPRWAVKWWPDVRDSVDDLIQLAAPNHGTTVAGLAKTFGRCYASCWQMADGSNYIKALNAGDETPGVVSYTSIYTLTDELVEPQVPTSTSTLDGASNIQIQSLCPGRTTDHAAISTGDAVGFALAVDALTHPGPADPKRFDIATCVQTTMPGAEPATLFTSGGRAGFNGTYVDKEPPLKAYAAAQAVGTDPSTQQTSSDDPASASSGTDGGSTTVASASHAAPGTENGSGDIPVGGIETLRYIAVALTLIAFGLALKTTARSAR